MASIYFKCEHCGYTETRRIPDYIRVSTTPCPHCGVRMIRQ